MRRSVATLVCTVLVVAGLAGCEEGSTISRLGQPSVMTGADLPTLVGEDPDAIVAFRRVIRNDDPVWVQIPVQIDERKVVAFGTQPPNNTTPGVEGTVYGHGSGGPTALQYVDPTTWVGPDTDPAFDADDELVFMIEDAGTSFDGDDAEPAGVVPGSGVELEITDPHGGDGWVYLFVSDGSLTPDAGRDYVDYDFALASGDYRTTYRRATGPNPETSTVSTRSYRIGYTDRWFETSWQIDVGPATGVDILDATKNQFSLATCGRSNLTFATAEGAFVANIDGPVRAIRSYVGANSGPLTQRTHLMYRDVEHVVTDLRVHVIPGVMDYLDFSAAAIGMTYRASTMAAGVTIDGSPDVVPAAAPRWETVTGPQGTVVSTGRIDTDIEGLSVGSFYRDNASPSEQQCFGDASFYGASGLDVTGGIPNTDPASTPFRSLSAVRTAHFLPPIDDPAALAAMAEALADDIDQPVTVTATPYAP